jgi:hypothetical protein
MATATIRVLVFDGSRQRLAPNSDVLLTVRPQFGVKPVFARFVKGNGFDVPVEVPPDGSGYAVVASVKGHEQAGLGPVNVEANEIHPVSLMLLPRNSSFQFARASWDRVQTRPSLVRFLMGKEPDADQVGARYTDLMELHPDSLACLLNIVAAFDHLPLKNQALGMQAPLDYLKSIEWGGGIRKDRFFGLASEALLADVRQAASSGLFEEEKGAAVFHPGATESYEQTEFDEANVQVTFHDKVFDAATQETLIRVELDMDYFKDLAAHALLEVIPNTLSGGRRKTDPRQIYVMRWMSGQARGKSFEPLYTIG